VTLPDEEVMELLSERFVIGWQNIERQSHVGVSRGYKCDQTAVGTTNGAGGRNVQIVVMAPDETVVHVLPGFWNAEDLLPELRLALDLHDLYRSEEHTPAQKSVMFSTLHKSFLRNLSTEAISRSRWQDFDQWEESNRGKTEVRDTFVLDDRGQPMFGANGRAELKPVVQVVHERLMQRQWKKLADFGMESFVDYGRAFYDNNAWVDKGRNFPRAVKANELREKAQEKERQLAAKAEKAAQKHRR